MSCQAMSTVIGEYEMLCGQRAGCIINLNNPLRKISTSPKNLDICNCHSDESHSSSISGLEMKGIAI